MTSPLLHTRVRESLTIECPPEQVISELEALAGGRFSMAVDDSDSDNILFEMIRGTQADIIISGIVKRWHGTDSRLDFEGEVDVPAANTSLQKILVIVVTSVMSILYWELLIISSSYIALRNPIAIWGILSILTGSFAYWLLMRDTNSKKRWRVQQEMAQFVEQIRSLQTIDTL